MGSPNAWEKQRAVGSQESGGTIKTCYSAVEILKATVSIELYINTALWFPLVGCWVGQISLASADVLLHCGLSACDTGENGQ